MEDYPRIHHAGQEIPWVELRLHSFLANTAEDIDRNIEYSLSQRYESFQSLVDSKSGAVSVVGSGPSLKTNWQRIKEVDGDIISCNAAFQFLLERGIVADYWFCFDADPLMLEFVTPRKDVTYLLASRCPVKTWELLEGCRIVCWHAAGDEHIQALLEKHLTRMEPMVHGGSAAVTRCMIMAYAMGYRTIHLWGCDSSFMNGDTHIRKSTTEEKRLLVMCNNKTFEVAPWMAQQAEDFKILAPDLRSQFGARLVIHGEGLIPHLAKTMDFETDFDSAAGKAWREVRDKARILWSQL